MTSATERLRALLDERGVEWEDMSALGYLATLWHGEDAACTALEGADDIPHGKVSVQACLTPEQAIDATLGRGTCRFEQIPEALYDDIECSECGVALWGFQMDIAGEGCPTKPRYCPNCGRAVNDD